MARQHLAFSTAHGNYLQCAIQLVDNSRDRRLCMKTSLAFLNHVVGWCHGGSNKLGKRSRSKVGAIQADSDSGSELVL